MKSIQITIVFIFVSLSVFSQISTTEMKALQDLYVATNGDNWNNSWDINKSVSQWQGVTIRDNKVVSISLLFNNLEGELPSSIGQLTYLETLELSFNKLSGSIPTEIGNLINLKTLAFNGNYIEGNIPESIGNLSKLTQLHVSSNLLTGVLPETICNLNYLEVLNVFDNNLSGYLPSQLAYSKSLKELMVAENNFIENKNFSAILLSNGASVNLTEPFTAPKNKDIIAIESEDEN